ncbi:cation-transporting ATPase E [Actinokineospora alba]|uniref:Cation-transporting ATPase E n=1 Tax=Actinokineospora alba TaxID=504798 RepID=A0A1H0LVK1_9PSEU|nr:HAD-IC family P-type ATPase [Actinokineospora alba]TDP67476.1 cation-transporting ATPase E [Actinokineospora alba]SDI47344.1 cation-transporting ATPase E [Actinokineospora alba]SDO72228.1 cation-transporting ATPase E [Actinokineospora alba]
MSAEQTVVVPETGLSAAEVAQRVADGQTNDVPTRASRSVWDIVRANVFTRINAIFGVLFLIIMSTGYFLDGLFGGLIVANSVIGVIQEVRAKRTLDRLAIVGQTKPRVLRDGVSKEVAPNEVVLDDVIEIGAGDQIVVDGELLYGEALEIDESLLTGESDPVVAGPGDPVLSGSFVVAGGGAYRATKVGREAYAAKLAEEASKFTLVDSELRNGINKILKFITYLLVPAGALSIYNQLSGDQALPEALRGMVAALVPMVPEGLILITAIAFAVGVTRLGKRQCLVNELPAIEGLARVDVVCADKTGTLTENGMRLSETRVLDGDESVSFALAALAAAEPRPNASLLAIAEAYPDDPGWEISDVVPFSSARKWSGVSFADNGNWVLGAPDVLLAADSAERAVAERIGSTGLRVLLLGRCALPVSSPDGPGEVVSVALVVLEQKVRPDAKSTLEYFAEQNVTVKVISGDNALSVSAVAGSLGLPNAGDAVDARTLPTDPYRLAETVAAGTVFGRVTPAQKRAMVGGLQSKGHTVAMTGDGVNDVLALKDADIGVAMGAGSPATRAVAQIVLLDNKFATLPHVVAEGRRVIGNIERVANLFLTKTVYSVLLALMVGIPGLIGFDALPYPFLPRHVTITGWFTIGLPAFVLSLAPNNERARSGFVARVMRMAIPAGVVIAVACFVSYVLTYPGAGASQTQIVQAGTTALITVIALALWVLAIVARPYTWWKVTLVAVMAAASALMFVLPLTQRLFLLDPSNGAYTWIAVACAGVGIVLIEASWWIGAKLRGEKPAFLPEN